MYMMLVCMNFMSSSWERKIVTQKSKRVNELASKALEWCGHCAYEVT